MKTRKLILVSILILFISLTLSINTLIIRSMEPEPVEGPRYGGTFITRMMFPHTMNPLLSFDFSANQFIGPLIFNNLVKLNQVYDILPDLAESWEVTPDAKEYTFNLYENAIWHDDTPCTSADVKWTFEDIIENKRVAYSLVKDIDFIEIIDDHTLRITLKNPNAAFLYNLCSDYPRVSILPKHIFAGTDMETNPATMDPIGTGPFKLDKWVKGQYAIFEANEDYFRGRPYLDRIVYKSMEPTMAETLLMLEKGEIQYSRGEVSYADLPQIEANPNLRVVPVIETTPINYYYNIESPIFSDLRCRKALAMAVDRTETVQRAYRGYTEEEFTPWLHNIKWAIDISDPSCPRYPEYDPVGAEALLDEAGYPRGSDGVRFKIQVQAAVVMKMDEVAYVLKENWHEIGVEVELDLMTWDLFVDKIISRRDFPEICVMGGVQGPDPSMMEYMITTDGVRNIGNWNSLELDNYMEMGKQVSGQEERKEIYDKVWQILIDELPRVNIVSFCRTEVISNDFRDMRFDTPNANIIGFERVWWIGGSLVSPKEAEDAIKSAESEINDLISQGYECTQALLRLNEAKAAQAENDYESAQTMANEATSLAIEPSEPSAGEQGPPGPPGPSGPAGKDAPLTYTALSIILSLASMAIAIFVYTKK